MTDKDKAKRDAIAVDARGAIAWGVIVKANGAMVNSGPRTLEAKTLRLAYAKHVRKMRKANPHFKLGRHTSPKPKGSA